MLGSEVQGIERLHAAQRRFEVNHQHELLVKSLWNEARYWEHKGKHKAELTAIEDRLRWLETDTASMAAARAQAHPAKWVADRSGQGARPD